MELKDRVNCSECEYLRIYDVVHTCYYCDHEDRADDMGKLGVDNLPEECPNWCPKQKK